MLNYLEVTLADPKSFYLGFGYNEKYQDNKSQKPNDLRVVKNWYCLAQKVYKSMVQFIKMTTIA